MDQWISPWIDDKYWSVIDDSQKIQKIGGEEMILNDYDKWLYRHYYTQIRNDD